jgi:hypothetical protein
MSLKTTQSRVLSSRRPENDGGRQDRHHAEGTKIGSMFFKNNGIITFQIIRP